MFFKIGNGSQLTVGDMEFLGRGGKLNAVALGELPFTLPVNGNAAQAARVVSYLLPIRPLHSDEIFFCILDAAHRGIASRLNSKLSAAFGISQDIARMVLCGPRPV